MKNTAPGSRKPPLKLLQVRVSQRTPQSNTFYSHCSWWSTRTPHILITGHGGIKLVLTRELPSWWPAFITAESAVPAAGGRRVDHQQPPTSSLEPCWLQWWLVWQESSRVQQWPIKFVSYAGKHCFKQCLFSSNHLSSINQKHVLT